MAPKELSGIVVDDEDAKRVGKWQHSQYSKHYIGKGYLHDIDGGKGEKTLSFDPDLPASGRYEVRLAYSPGGNRAEKVPVTVFSADGEKTIAVNQREAPPVDGRFVSIGKFRFERDGQSFVIVSNTGTAGHVVADAVQFLPVEAPAAASVGAARENTARPPSAEPAELKALSDQVKRLEAELRAEKAKSSRRPAAMSVVERPEPGDLCVHIRGSVHNPGDVVPRGFPKVVASNLPPIPSAEGGRRQLAEWLTSRDNPLTARVIVNRVWHWLFGAGLVRTTDNFGTSGEEPSHPELLDRLAVTFVEDGWSVKRLIRRIVLSEVYCLSTAENPRARAIDPENRLLWRMNRRRLDAECLRDAMLSVSGALRPDRGEAGFRSDLSVDYGFVDTSSRRSVYVPVFRNALPDVFEAFDFADPSTVTGRRSTSTVAPQALFLMNHPFVIDQSQLAATRLMAENHAGDMERLTRAYRLTLGRSPSAGECTEALRFLEQARQGGAGEMRGAWAQLVQALFATLDFRYIN